MVPAPIPVLKVAGSHRQIGRQIGEAYPEQVRAAAAFQGEPPPAGRTREEQLAIAADYRAVTEAALPWLIEELDGCAEGAGVDPLAFFAASIEEIWYEPRTRALTGRCSDLLSGPAATENGHLLVAHNNDLAPSTESKLVAIEKSVPGDPVVFQIGGAPWLSVGFNSAGLALTGNELSPNDERVGISRSLQVFEIMRATTVNEAVRASLRPDRASSYNNVLAHSDGSVVNVEGSATDAELTGLDEHGTLAHTNHYVCDRMLPFEGDPEYAESSNRRYVRARRLLDEYRGRITRATMREMLSDHEGAPDSLCRHPDPGSSDSKTVFWCVADMTELRITFDRGNPCDSQAQHYEFAAAARPEGGFG
jgi:isopenicillin-N N-acyltransferase like protein